MTQNTQIQSGKSRGDSRPQKFKQTGAPYQRVKPNQVTPEQQFLQTQEVKGDQLWAPVARETRQQPAAQPKVATPT